ncbi:hypothetical protein TNCV_3215311 [Trichonephila clavipes]|nr:hypothetical protein TNCV_3215311 [Trichonephila clavipes]
MVETRNLYSPSNSTYAAPAFIVEQPFHESTPRRVFIDYSRPINSITKLDLHPIDHMEDVIKRIVGKCYISKIDVKSAFNTIRIRKTGIFKTGFVTPDGHYEFLRMPFGVTNDPSTTTRAIKLAYEHLAPHNINTYIDDISTSHDDFSYHLKVLYKILEATRNAGFKLTPGKTQLAVSEIALFGRILSQEGLGAVLSQDENGKRRVIEYASRTLKDTETSYHSNELECTAIHWALTEKFRLHLLGHKFQLITDNYTTAYVVAKSAVNRKFARYLVDLAEFDFTTVHRPRKQNVIADHLSRFPTSPVCLTVTASHQSEICTNKIKMIFVNIFFKEQNPNKKTMSIISNYIIDNNTLARVKKKIKIFCSCDSQGNDAEQKLIACHDDVGHMDAKKILHNLKQRYWWPNMRKDCKIYQLPIPTTPWEIVSADHVIFLPQTRAGNTNMLVHIDHVARYVVATSSASLGAHSVTDALYHNIILRYGPPNMYISDRGTAFTARHAQHFLQKYGITQSMTPPYSPQANSIVERANGIIVSTLKKLTDKNPDKWEELLPNALLAINTTKQNSTKKSPFYLLFGYEPRLPCELPIGSFIDDTLREDQLDLLILARAEAANNIYEAHLENKHRFDLHRRSHSFKAGDLALYYWPKQGNHKLSPIFKGPFVIVRPVGAVCYKIKSRTLQNKFIKVVHVQHLRPYFKRDADVMQNKTSDEENDSSAENQDPADHQEVSETTESSSSRNHLCRNRRHPKRFEQYIS